MSSKIIRSLRQRNQRYVPSKTQKTPSPSKGNIIILLDKNHTAIGYGTIASITNSPTKKIALDTIQNKNIQLDNAKIAYGLVFDKAIADLRTIIEPSEQTQYIRQYVMNLFGHATLNETLIYNLAFKYAIDHGYVLGLIKNHESSIFPVYDPNTLYTMMSPKIISLDKIKAPNSYLLLFNDKKRIIGYAITKKHLPLEGILNIETYANCTYFYDKYHAAYVKYVAPIDDIMFQIYVLKSAYKNDVNAKMAIIKAFVKEFIQKNKEHIKGKTEFATQLHRLFEFASKNNSKNIDVFTNFNVLQHTMIDIPVDFTLIHIAPILNKIEGDKITYAPIRYTRKKLPSIVTGKMGGKKLTKTNKI